MEYYLIQIFKKAQIQFWVINGKKQTENTTYILTTSQRDILH